MSKILVVDDQLTSRQILKQLVSNIEQDVKAMDFASPVEALTWTARNPADLTLVDYKMLAMNLNTLIGYEILKDSPSKFLQMGSIIALGHHEKYDGTGYPYGLKGNDIPIEARIVAVADVFDALVSERPYKNAWSTEAALEYMENNSGKHFDPNVFNAFKAQIDSVVRIQGMLPDVQIAFSR